MSNEQLTINNSHSSFIIHHSSFIILALCLFLFFACAADNPTSAAQPVTPVATASPTPTPTSPPPPPTVSFTPVSPETISPIIVQRFPRRGEELATDGIVEFVFDRAMNNEAVERAFTLQSAADQPEIISGDFAWPDERTMNFTPADSLEQSAVYDVVLTQEAIAADEAPLKEPFTFRFSTPGFLEVTQVIPADGTVDVETNATITVMFNRPIVPLTSLEEAKNFPEPLEFEPAIAGRGEWLNTSIYVFTPDEDVPGGVTFTARVKAGQEDVAGKTFLPNDFEWRFVTQPPEVVWTTPNDGQTLIPIEDSVQVSFSQPVDPQSAQEKFHLTPVGLFDSDVPGDFQAVDSTLTFTPAEHLDFDTTYAVNIDAGVAGKAGGNGMVNPYTFRFTTVPLPRILETHPFDGQNDASPYTDFTIIFNTPINPDTVMPHIEMVPPLPITPTQVYTYYSPWNNSFSISFGAEPSKEYQVRITPGIEDPYGNKTTDNLNVRFRTSPLAPNYQLRTPDFIGTYDADLPAKIVVGFINIDTLNLRLYQLAEEEILRPQWELYEYKPDDPTLIREWQERLEAPANKQTFQPIDLVEGGGALEPGLYLLETDAPQLREDYYRHRHMLVVTKSNLTLKVGQRDALVWATDLTTGQPLPGQEVIFYDEDRNRQQLGTVTTDSDGLARLDLSERQNRSGILAVILPSLEGGNEAGQNFSAVAENWARGVSPYEFGLDYAYTLPDFNTHIYTDRPIYRPGQTIYFKGVIRAEDDVEYRLPDIGRVMVTIFDATYETIFEEEVEVNANGTFHGEVELAEGASLGNYTIALNFADQYAEQYVQVAAYRPPEFEVVVEPEKPELLRGEDVNAVAGTNYFFGGPLAGADVTWNILAENYRFKPAQLGNYSFDDADDPYICFDCWWYHFDTFPQSLLSGSGTTDASGQLPITADGQEIDDLLGLGSYRLTIEATATGPDNQFISGRDTVILHKGDYYIGLSPQENVADAGQETAVDLIAVDWAAQRLPDKTLDVQIVRYDWVNTFIEQGSGGYWTYETEKELIDNFTVTTDNQGEAVARFTPPKGGSYQIIVQDADSLSADDGDRSPSGFVSPIRSSIFVWVAGEDDVSWRRENHDRLTLISDKAEYAPGETAEILIPSPFDGDHMALVTVERGRIIEQEVLEMTNNSQIYRLPITEQYAPNIYVSVVLIQGREGPQSGDAPRLADYKVGILPIDVTPGAQVLNIKLTPSVEQAEPGQAVAYSVDVTDVNNQPVSAEFSLDLVDKAILTLRPRTPEAIVKAYYDRRGLGISTSSGLAVSANRLLLELAEDLGLEQDAFVAQSEAGIGGGEVAEKSLAGAPAPTPAEAPMALSAEVAVEEEAAADEADGAFRQRAEIPAGVEVREEFSDTAFWNPVVVTDQNGRAEVDLTLPDNLTTWVMRGVGVTNDTLVGEATVELVSTMPLLIRPVAPRFFVVDDRAQLAANINNNTAEDLEVEVTLSAEGVVISGDTPPVQTVTIPARDESKVTWDVSVEDVTETELVFAAVSADGQYSDASKPRLTTGPDGTLLVFRYTAPDIVGTGGQLAEGGSRTEVVALPPNFDERRGELRIQLDRSLAAGMRDGLDYLEHYEYECTEQTVSRFLPNVLTFNALQSLGIENEELENNLPGLVEEGLNKLYTQQKPDGGWGWWSSDDSNVHVTSYVVFALTKARQADVDVSATVLANGQNFLLDHLQTTRQLNVTRDANRHAFVLYALAEGGVAPQDSLEALFDAREKLAHYARAYLALALDLTDSQKYSGSIDTLLSDINNAAILSATGAHWEEDQYDFWAMNTDTRSTAIILDALTKLDPANELNPNVVRWLMIARRDGIWETTQETAWALIALTDWMVETRELDADYDFSTFLNDDELAGDTANKDNVGQNIQLTVPIADLLVDTGNLLTVARTDGNGRLYYTAHLEVYLPVEEIEPAERGIIVSRSYKLESCLAEQLEDKSVVCNEVREAKLGDVIRVDLTIIAPNDLYYVVVEDPLPAGAEAIDTGLATTSLLAMDPTLSRTSPTYLGEEIDLYGRPYYWWWWNWYSRSELRDEKVVLFADYLSNGTYEYSYTIRATLPGDYHVIPTVASEFYFPEVFGRSDGRLLSIGR